jgi:hypothetical protein
VSIFFIFRPNKIFISPTSVVSFLSPPRCHISSCQHRHVAAPCHASFSWSQIRARCLCFIFNNTSFCCLLSWVKTKILNSHHHRRLPSSNSLTLTLQYYKKIILNLGHSPHHLITSSFFLLLNQSTTPPELYQSLSFIFTTVPCPSFLHINI